MRFGIIGVGVIGPQHAEAIASLPEATLVAVADVEPGRAAELAGKYGAAAYTSVEEMLTRDDLDVVTVCTPSGLHGRHACQVMCSGRHVIVEKPMDISHAAIQEMLRVQRDTGVQLAVISQHRFDEASQRVHRLVAEGALGRLVLGGAHIACWRAQTYYDSGSWRGTRALDGGVLLNQSIHAIDLLLWLMGPARSVVAHTDTLVHRMEAEDVAAAVVRFENGALGTIAATSGAYPGVVTRVEVFGDRGSAIIENDRLATLAIAQEGVEVGPMGLGDKPQPAGGSAESPAGQVINSHARQIQDMIDAIRGGRRPLVDGDEGRRPVELILAIDESARSGREVMLA